MINRSPALKSTIGSTMYSRVTLPFA